MLGATKRVLLLFKSHKNFCSRNQAQFKFFQYDHISIIEKAFYYLSEHQLSFTKSSETSEFTYQNFIQKPLSEVHHNYKLFFKASAGGSKGRKIPTYLKFEVRYCASITKIISELLLSLWYSVILRQRLLFSARLLQLTNRSKA